MTYTNKLFLLICNFCIKIALFQKIGIKFLSKNLIKSSKYYYNKYHLEPEKIVAGTVGFFLIIFSISLLPILFLNLIILLPVVILIAFFLSFSFYFKIIREYNNEDLEISKYADLITEDFIFALKSSQSLYQAIKYIAQGNYPVISNKFKELVYSVNLGQDPLQILTFYLKYQPSMSLQSSLLPLINGIQLDPNYEKILGEESQQNLRNEYERKTLQLESKIMVISAINIFLPIILGLCLIFYGSGEGPFFLFLVPFQLLISLLLKRKLIKNKSEIIGG